MIVKTRKRTKTTSLVTVHNKMWGILPNKVLYFYSDNSITEFEISEEDSRKMLDEIKEFSWNKLLNYLSYRERSQDECRNYLRQKAYLKENLQVELIDKAISLNYINDKRFTELYIDDMIKKGRSKNEMVSKLRNKKIANKLIEDIIPQKLTPKTMENILNLNLAKVQKRYANLSKKKKKEKILNYLTRKGFSYWEVKQKLQD